MPINVGAGLAPALVAEQSLPSKLRISLLQAIKSVSMIIL
jgi:hypothetical protein